MFESRFSHLALLLPSVERAALKLQALGYAVGPTELWEGEGTKEIYVGEPTLEGRLLLMEPTRSGAYSEALKKRGPGLHHIAIDVLDLEGFILGLANSGWLLHPKSLGTIKKTRTAWLARPGLPALIEVQQRTFLGEAPSFVTRIAMRLSAREHKMMSVLGLEAMVSLDPSGPSFSIGRSTISVDELVRHDE